MWISSARAGTGSAGTVYEKRGLEDGEHTLVLTFTDRYNPAYGGGFASMQIAVFDSRSCTIPTSREQLR